MKIFLVVGARPNFMKLAPLWRELKKNGKFEPYVVHTGQHYDYEMSKVFFEDLGLPEPDFYLGVGSDTHARQTANTMVKLEELFLKEKPDLVVVFGDVNSTLAAALVTSKILISLAHVEAGLRSFRRSMPEEINRVVTDLLSDYLFAPDEIAVQNLKNEGKDEKNIYFVGNIMIDSLNYILEKIEALEDTILEKYKLKKRQYALLTLHRPINVDKKETLEQLFNIFRKIAARIQIVFPVHPRTRKNMETWGIEANGVILLDPLRYREFVALEKNALFVLTDSGGVQEETTVLGVPCLTLRPETERPVTEILGTNTVVDRDEDKILKYVNIILNGSYKNGKIPPLWDGKTAKRIVGILERVTGGW